MITTNIWTNFNGKKTPVTLMDFKHLRASYVRVKTIVLATKEVERLKGITHREFSGGDRAKLKVMIESPMNLDYCIKWSIIFEEEFNRRGRKIPLVTLDNIVNNFEEQKRRKQYTRENFKSLNL